MGFIIQCTKCGEKVELKDGYRKRESNIHVYDSGQYTVSIECNECGNEIVSSDDD